MFVYIVLFELFFEKFIYKLVELLSDILIILRDALNLLEKFY
jgi:hypothetical protein